MLEFEKDTYYEDDGLTEGESPPVTEMISNIELACMYSRSFFAFKVAGLDEQEWQSIVFSDLDDGALRVSIRSGHGPGKTTLCAICAIHFLLFRTDVKIICTAPSASQLSDGLYPEICKWVAKLPDWLKNRLTITSSRITRKSNPSTNFMSFRTARKDSPEAFQGIHAKFVMFIADEASGIPDVIYEAGRGMLSTAGAIWILISNPTRLSGFFYDTHHKLKEQWNCYRVSSFDTDKVDQVFIDMIRKQYGEEHDQWRIRVLGEFPLTDEHTLISRAAVEKCLEYDPDLFLDYQNSTVTWGVDPARGNDYSTLIKRCGNVIYYAWRWRTRDTMILVNKIYQEWTDTPEIRRPEQIYIDSNGIGAGVADRLRQLGLPIVDVNVSTVATDEDRYRRLRDECWWKAKEEIDSNRLVIWVNDNLSEEVAEALVEEFSAPLADYTETGKTGVESKKLTIARLRRSPDLADAYVITNAFKGCVMSGQFAVNDNNSPFPWDKPVPSPAEGVA